MKKKFIFSLKKLHQNTFITINTDTMTRDKLARLEMKCIDWNKLDANEKTLSSNLKQSVVTTWKLFASQNCKPDL